MTFSKSITRISDNLFYLYLPAPKLRINIPLALPGLVFIMNTIRETFDKSERLCSTKIISGLFENGNIFHTTLFKIVWSTAPVLLPFPAQIAFSVSKKGFALAVTRNLIKRRMREAWRINKYLLYESLARENKQIVLFVIVKENRVPDYLTIEKSMKVVVDRLISLTGGVKSEE
jgi:ribonuclease P protein component